MDRLPQKLWTYTHHGLLLKRSWNKAAISETQKLSRMSSFNSVDFQKLPAQLLLAHPPLHCLSTKFQACSQGFKPESQEKGSSLQSPHTATRGQPLHLLQPRTFMFKKNVLIAMCFSSKDPCNCYFFFLKKAYFSHPPQISLILFKWNHGFWWKAPALCKGVFVLGTQCCQSHWSLSETSGGHLSQELPPSPFQIRNLSQVLRPHSRYSPYILGAPPTF